MIEAISDGYILRAGQLDRPPLSYCDSKEPRPPANLFQCHVLNDPPSDFSEFEGWVAYSVFWKEHPLCPGPRDIIQYLNIRNLPQKPYQSVWQIDSNRAKMPFSISIDNKKTIHCFTVIHWPEDGADLLQAHAHLMLPKEFSGAKKKHKKRRKIATTMLLKYLQCVLILSINELSDDEIKGLS